MKYVNKSITEATEPFVAHIVNNKGIIGKGVSGVIIQKWPRVKKDYIKHIKHAYGLGTVVTSAFELEDFTEQTVFSLVCQDGIGRDKRRLSYKYFLECMEILNDDGVDYIAIPYKMGCGLAGGDWEVMRELLEFVEETTFLQFAIYTNGEKVE